MDYSELLDSWLPDRGSLADSFFDTISRWCLEFAPKAASKESSLVRQGTQ